VAGWPDEPAEEDAGDWFRPVWADDAAPPSRPGAPRPAPIPTRPPQPAPDLPALLGPLCAAQDALARLDAKAEAAAPPVRAGLAARLALREAAGWLAHAAAWVHPIDLALRDAGLTGLGDLPNTPGHHWDAMDGPALLRAEAAVQRGLRLARLLRRLAEDPPAPRGPETAARLLGGLGEACDPARLGEWQSRWTRRDPGAPALLRAAAAARDWMEAGVQDLPSPLAALAAAAGLLARAGLVRAVPLPFWAAAPALASGDPGALPRLRGDAAARLCPGAPPPWETVFLAMAAEAARAGLRELDRLQRAAAAGAGLATGLDRRSRLPAAVGALLREPAVTPKSLARSLRVTPQAALRLLRELEQAALVRETTGRRSFRAFAL
jgi:hypothetical protein